MPKFAITMSKEEKLAFLNEVLYCVKAKKIVRTQTEFARAIGVDPATLSLAKNGRDEYLSDSLFFRIRDFLHRNNIVLPSEEKQHPKSVSVPLETIELFTTMSATIERLTKEVERLNSVIENLSKDGRNVKRA